MRQGEENLTKGIAYCAVGRRLIVSAALSGARRLSSMRRGCKRTRHDNPFRDNK